MFIFLYKKRMYKKMNKWIAKLVSNHLVLKIISDICTCLYEICCFHTDISYNLADF